MTNCHFDADTNATSGTFYAIGLEDGYAQVLNNEAASGYALLLNMAPSGSLWVWATGNYVRSTSDVETSKLYATTAILKVGSYLEMQPRERITSSATPAISDGYSSAEMLSTTTVPQFTLPTKFFPGQRLEIFVKNGSGAGWAVLSLTGGTITDITGVSYPTVANTEYGYLSLIVMDIDVSGTYTWTVIDARN